MSQNYLDLVERILYTGVNSPNRTGVDTLKVFGATLRYDLSQGTVPILTTKRMAHKTMLHELLWLLKGTGNIKYLQDNGVHIWDGHAVNGELGPIYGYQWRKWPVMKFDPTDICEVPRRCCSRSIERADLPYLPGYTLKEPDWVLSSEYFGSKVLSVTTAAWVPPWYAQDLKVDKSTNRVRLYYDQLADIIHKLKHDPHDRRMLMTSWNVAAIPSMRLPPCHYVCQFVVIGERLNLIIHQRSVDVFIGLPFDLGLYSYLLRIVAQQTGWNPGELLWTGGDCHIYGNHLQQMHTQLTRKPKPLPKLDITMAKNIDDYRHEDFKLWNYEYHPAIKGELNL